MKPWLIFESLFRFTSLSTKELEQKSDMKNHLREVLIKKKEKLKTTDDSSSEKSLMDMFIELEEFTDEDIINECCTLMMAGQDSVSSTTVFTLYYLAKHPEIQDKVREELQGIFDKDERVPDLDDLNEMKYLEQCIKESMRICPVAIGFSRSLSEDVKLGETVLPSGAFIIISPFVTHRLASIYPEPAKYDPERFSPENIQKLHPCAFIPFGTGPTNCVGKKYAMLELKTIISTIVRNCYFELSRGHEELVFGFRITMRAKGGVWLRFSRIQKSNVENNINKV